MSNILFPEAIRSGRLFAPGFAAESSTVLLWASLITPGPGTVAFSLVVAVSMHPTAISRSLPLPNRITVPLLSPLHVLTPRRAIRTPQSTAPSLVLVVDRRSLLSASSSLSFYGFVFLDDVALAGRLHFCTRPWTEASRLVPHSLFCFQPRSLFDFISSTSLVNDSLNCSGSIDTTLTRLSADCSLRVPLSSRTVELELDSHRTRTPSWRPRHPVRPSTATWNPN